MKLFQLTVILTLGLVIELRTEAAAQLTKITTAYISDSAGVLPLWIAKDTGIFARNGLEVQPCASTVDRGDGSALGRASVCSGFGTRGGRKRVAWLQRRVCCVRYVDPGLCAREPAGNKNRDST